MGYAGGGGVAPADPQAHPQLELWRARARGTRQSGVPRLHPRRRREDARRQDDGALGRGAGGRRDQTDPHQDGDHGTEPWLDRRPPHARGHHGGGDQHPPSDRFEFAGRRRAGAHSHHEEDHADRGRGRNQAARPEPPREPEGAHIARAARSKAKQGQEKLKRAYGQLLNSTGRVAGQAKRFAQEIAAGVKRSADVVQQLTLEGLRDKLDAMVPLVRKVMKQTRARILRGATRGDGKLVSLFEPETEIIRKGKAGKLTEFGKMVKLQEAENQIVTDYEVYDRRPNDADLLIA